MGYIFCGDKDHIEHRFASDRRLEENGKDACLA
jgi:hypothetical protein